MKAKIQLVPALCIHMINDILALNLAKLDVFFKKNVIEECIYFEVTTITKVQSACIQNVA